MRIPSLDIPEDDLTFVTDLLKQKHVLVVHGSGFGQKPGTRHMRIVFLPQDEVLQRGVREDHGLHAGAVQVEAFSHGFTRIYTDLFLSRSKT